jgi:DNA-directed RNA polymerase sigma subunit (sigma70/sigma32)
VEEKMSIEAMKQALEALEQINQLSVGENAIALPGEIDAAMDSLRAAIEQPREWVELTDDEARALVNRATFGDRTNWQALVYMVDAKLKEKNT